MKPLSQPAISADLSQSALPSRRTRLLVHLRQTAPLALLVAAFVLPCGVKAQGRLPSKSLAPETGRLKITIPAGLFKDRYWIYVDETIVSSPPYEGTGKWGFAATPQGEEVYGKGGLTAVIDDNGKILQVNSELARENHFYRTLDLPLRPGTHTVELLVEGAAPQLESAFPFVITGKDLGVRGRQITEYSPDPPKGWNTVSAPARPAIAGCEEPNPDPPDAEQIARLAEWYKKIPVVQALRAADAPYLSGSKKVLWLELPVELGGSREFDDAQVQTIVDSLEFMVDNRIPPRDKKFDCDRGYPKFLAAYVGLRERIYSELNSFRTLARDVEQTR